MNYPTRSARISRHFEARSRHRGLRNEVRDLIYWFGTEFTGAHAVYITLLRRELPPDLRDAPLVEEALGWVLVLSHAGTALTCYYHPDAAQFARRRSEVRACKPARARAAHGWAA
jgi:hypothetical protein